jgi:hypothetical protein
MKNTSGIMGVDHERKRPLETSRHVRYEDNNLTMDCKEVKWEDVGRNHLLGDGSVAAGCCEHDCEFWCDEEFAAGTRDPSR